MGRKQASENLRVAVRIRNLIPPEIEDGHEIAVKADLTTNQIVCPREVGGDPDVFPFDSVFDHNFTQEDVYQREVAPLVDSVFNGYNASVFAYGQSGSGKSYTMSGKGKLEDREHWGVLPRVMYAVFNRIAKESSDKLKFNVSINYIDLYLGHPYDLIGGTGKPLKVAPLSGGVFHVKGSETKTVTNVEEAMKMYLKAGENRIEKPTKLNPFSSRSHAIFTMLLEKLDYEDPTAPVRTNSKFLLVDLAGSEKVGQTGAEGTTAAEGRNINLQLSALARVIDQVVEGNPKPTVRGCDLTMLLADAIGGTSRTVMFANASCSDRKVVETVGTLRFASKAKNIKNKPIKNQDPKDARIEELMNQVEELKKRVSGGGSNLELEEEMKQKIEQLESEKGALEQQLSDEQERYKDLEEKLSTQKDVIEQQLSVVNESSVGGGIGGGGASALQDEVQSLNDAITDVLLLLNGFINHPEAFSPEDKENIFSTSSHREALMAYFEDTSKLIDEKLITTLHTVANLFPAAASVLTDNRQLLNKKSTVSTEELDQIKDEARAEIEEMKMTFSSKELALTAELDALRSELSDKSKALTQMTSERDAAQQEAKQNVEEQEAALKEAEAKALEYREELEIAGTREQQLQNSLEEARSQLSKNATATVQMVEADQKEKTELQHRVMTLGEELKSANEVLAANDLKPMDRGLSYDGPDAEHAKLLGSGTEASSDLVVQLQQQLRVQHQLQSLRHLQQTKLTDLVSKFETLKSGGKVEGVKTTAADLVSNIEVQELIKQAEDIKEREVKDIQADYEHKLNKLVRKLNKEQATTQKQVEKMESKLKHEKETLENQKKELTETNGQLNDEVQKLKAALSSAKTADEEEKNRLKAGHDRLKHENERTSKHLAEVSKELEDAQIKAQQASKDALRHEANLRTNNQKMKEKEKQLASLQSEFTLLEKRESDAQAARQKAEKSMKEHTAKVEKAMAERARQWAQETERKLSEQAESHMDDIAREKEKQQELRDKNKKLKDKLHKADTRHDQMILENEWLQTQVEENKVEKLGRALGGSAGLGGNRQAGDPIGPPPGAGQPISTYGRRNDARRESPQPGPSRSAWQPGM